MGVMLDKRDLKILTFIMDYVNSHNNNSPTIQEVGEAVDNLTLGSTYSRLLKLQVAGYLVKDARTSRTLRVTQQGKQWIQSGSHYL